MLLQTVLGAAQHCSLVCFAPNRWLGLPKSWELYTKLQSWELHNTAALCASPQIVGSASPSRGSFTQRCRPRRRCPLQRNNAKGHTRPVSGMISVQCTAKQLPEPDQYWLACTGMPPVAGHSQPALLVHAELAVHGAVLSVMSEYFRTLIQSWQGAERRLQMLVGHDEAHVAEALVEFMYTGELPRLGHDDMLRLMRLSDKFQVRNCPAACARRFADTPMEELSLDTVCAIFEWPGFLQEAQPFAGVSSKAWAKLLDVFGDLEAAWQDSTRRQQFLSLPIKAVKKLLASDQLAVVSENTVLVALAGRDGVDAARYAAANEATRNKLHNMPNRFPRMKVLYSAPRARSAVARLQFEWVLELAAVKAMIAQFRASKVTVDRYSEPHYFNGFQWQLVLQVLEPPAKPQASTAAAAAAASSIDVFVGTTARIAIGSATHLPDVLYFRGQLAAREVASGDFTFVNRMESGFSASKQVGEVRDRMCGAAELQVVGRPAQRRRTDNNAEESSTAGPPPPAAAPRQPAAPTAAKGMGHAGNSRVHPPPVVGPAAKRRRTDSNAAESSTAGHPPPAAAPRQPAAPAAAKDMGRAGNSRVRPPPVVGPRAKRQRTDSNAAESSTAGHPPPAAAPRQPAAPAAAKDMGRAGNSRVRPPAPLKPDKRAKTPQLLALVAPGGPEAQRLQALQVLAVRSGVMQKAQQADIVDAPGALAAIAVLLHHGEAAMRQAAATCLGNLTEHQTRLGATQGVLVGLATLLGDGCLQARLEAVRALLKLTKHHAANQALLRAVPGAERVVEAICARERDVDGDAVDWERAVTLANRLRGRLQGREEEAGRRHALRLQRREEQAARTAAMLEASLNKMHTTFLALLQQ
ncbi:hypothetical protein COO60DRAFT_1624856 [Scenedesmus sp. NREL 46B-D3]|nr:hypothetical protein COO60DRAFT_1624856 [Scenedesmus sp. NREL 46B-D3]